MTVVTDGSRMSQWLLCPLELQLAQLWHQECIKDSISYVIYSCCRHDVSHSIKLNLLSASEASGQPTIPGVCS
jgi:hypothetical protein